MREQARRSWWPSVPERPPRSATIRDDPSAPALPMSAAPLRVAVLGAGTVGREVVRAFEAFPERLAVDGGPRLELAGVAVRDLGRRAARGDRSRAADRRSGPPRGGSGDGRRRRGHGRRRAGPDAYRRRARGRQARRHRQQARHRPSRPGPRADRSRHRDAAPLRGRRRRRHPRPRSARRPRRRPGRARPGHRQRLDQSPPDRDGRRRALVRRGRSPRPRRRATSRPTRRPTSTASMPPTSWRSSSASPSADGSTRPRSSRRPPTVDGGAGWNGPAGIAGVTAFTSPAPRPSGSPSSSSRMPAGTTTASSRPRSCRPACRSAIRSAGRTE